MLFVQLEFRFQSRSARTGADTGILVIHPQVDLAVGSQLVGMLRFENSLCAVLGNTEFKVVFRGELQTADGEFPDSAVISVVLGHWIVYITF